MGKLTNIEALAKAAQPGPFDIERRDDDCGYINYIVHGATGDVAWCRDELNDKAKAQAAFIAAVSPAVVTKLITALRAAQAHRELENDQTSWADGRWEQSQDVLDAAMAALEAE